MASSSSGLGCIGKCTSGLSYQELDAITDHIEKTLTHPRGIEIFRQYLVKGNRKTDIRCLELYQRCSDCLKRERCRLSENEPTGAEQLSEEFDSVLSAAEELDDVPDIDLALMMRFTEAQETQSREAMMEVLEDTRIRLRDHLRQAHKGFRIYVMQPCPKTR